MSVSELVISGYLLGDVCEFFIKKIMVADYLFNCRIILNGEIDIMIVCFFKFQIIGAFLAYRYRNLMNPLAPQAMANRNGGSIGAEFNPHTI